MEELTKLLDKAKLKIFSDSVRSSAFLAPLLCQCSIEFTEECETARTNGIVIQFNPDFFKNLNNTSERAFLLFHELWHIAKMHQLRCGNKDKVRWNMACDYHINIMLKEDFSLDMPEGGLLDEQYRHLSEEEIYSLLPEDAGNPSSPYLDLAPLDSNEEKFQNSIVSEILGAVSTAVHSCGSGVNKEVVEILNKFTAPQINWKQELQDYFKETYQNQDYSWKRPSRRIQDCYFPSITGEDEGRLEHLAYFVDTSGSISEEQIVAFNSEIKFIKDELKPKKLTVITFDTSINEPISYSEDDEFEFLEVIGRGGTSLEDVYDWIEKNKPTASVIFSDLICDPMPKPSTPVVWCVIKYDEEISVQWEPHYGKVIPIKCN